MSDHVQIDFKRRISEYAAGQPANAMPSKRETGELVTTGGTPAYPDNLPFGFACGWLSENKVARRVTKKAFADLTANINNSVTTVNLTLKPGFARPAVGAQFRIGTETFTINAVGANDAYTVAARSGSSAHTAGDDVTLVHGGPTNFAGVAVRNVALPGDNSPVDTYNDLDLVTVGSEGDWIVVTDKLVAFGDYVSVNVGSTAADYGKFSNTAEGTNYIGIPGAMFTWSGTINSVHLASLRLPKQPV